MEINALAFTNATASHKWRLTPIANRMNEGNDHAMYVTDFTAWDNNLIGANLVILEMLVGPEMVDKAHEQGAKVIYEADDAVIDTYGRERKNLQHLSEDHRGNAIETIRKCDAVIVTNKRLADNYTRFTDKPIYILPNYIDLQWYNLPPSRPERNTDEIRIGWFGSRGHFEDLRMLVPAIARILEEFPQARFIYCGYGGASSDKHYTELMWGEDVFKEIPRERREFILPVQEDLWPIKHHTLDLDIGLAPLVDDEFNRCKTPIKWMEYALCDTATVCSPILYGEHYTGEGSTVVDGETGLFANAIDDWYSQIKLLCTNHVLRKQLAQNAKQEVLTNWNIDNHWEKWVDVYQKVLSS